MNELLQFGRELPDGLSALAFLPIAVVVFRFRSLHVVLQRKNLSRMKQSPRVYSMII